MVSDAEQKEEVSRLKVERDDAQEEALKQEHAGTAASPGPAPKLRPNLVLFLCLFTHNSINCTFSIIFLALPLLSDEFGVSESAVLWVAFVPQLVGGMLSTPIGRAADVWGRKRCVLLGCLEHLTSMLT